MEETRNGIVQDTQELAKGEAAAEGEKRTAGAEPAGKKSVGTVQIADDVVAMIAAYASMEVEGVSSMAGSVPAELLGKVGYKNAARGVRVEVKDGCASVDVHINMAYGYNIPATSSKVQARIKQAVENMTGLTVTDVNVRIAGITFDTDRKAAEEN